jgi:dTDP-4-amino-4,6-dideoxygalactose transaminase
MPISRLYSIPRFALPYTAADFAASLKAIWSGSPLPDAFGLLGDAPKFWTRSGRQALRLLLGALDLPPGSGVALPLFTDPSLVRAIVAAGHHPVFIDVDPRFLTMDPQSLADAQGTYSAVVAVHIFGQLADMPSLMDAAAGVPVIEDAAHAPLSYLNERMAGSYGVASFYSFASTKYWPAGGGGLALVRQLTMVPRLSHAVLQLSQPSRSRELRSLSLQAAKAVVFNRRLYGFFGRPMRRWAESWALLEPCLDLESIQRFCAAGACRQAPRFAERVVRQRANSLLLLERIAGAEEVVLPWERPGAEYNYHMFPVLLRNRQERAAIMAAMWEQFVDTSKLYSGVVEEARRFGYTGGCPVAESVADRLITLPNYAGLSEQDIETVAEVFVSSLREYRRNRPAAAMPPVELTSLTS